MKKLLASTVPVTETAVYRVLHSYFSLSSPLHAKKRDAVANCCGCSYNKLVDDIQDIITLLKIYILEEPLTLNTEVSKTLR
jgi:hypothetical protein